ncbi:PRP19 non-snRNP sliceosome component required for DNA repair [Cryptosporidium sp. chipmunk genotype I]|uniref:PRP19 non-snRNP sliceosome component required for DNA repair n=1 Tax=Cryptosporidium sp. chipmunk genotype I TaxID=1280935 RepID=UPI00351A4BF1|nr:PRP19 non-snRNP sliceosome component required for DNA repair [Cryptosporidium sp. chipmunk genotype I]
MSLICSISGTTPENPVISKTGYVFEKRLIEEYIRCNNSCPITKSELSLDDLIQVKSTSSLKPRLIKNTSIPGILDSLRTEWDAMVMEMFQLRSELEQTKAQLTHSLYQHDAACRVIARITREKDQAINRLAEIQNSILENDEDNSSNFPNEGGKRIRAQENFINIPEDVVSLFTEYSEKMRPIRKKQTFPYLMPAEQVKEFSLKSELELKDNCKLEVGIAINDQIYVSGVENGEILVSNVDFDAKEVSSISISYPENCEKAVSISAIGKYSGGQYFSENASQLPPLHVLACFQNSSKIYIFSRNQENDKSFNLSVMDFNSSFQSNLIINSLENHPLGMHIIANSTNKGLFSMFDLESRKQLFLHQLEHNHSYSQLKPHPDGLILGGITLSGNIVDIWDIRNLEKVSSLEYPTRNNTVDTKNSNFNRKSSLCFSNNGYYLLSTSLDNKIHLWDLRKSSIIDSLELSTLPDNSDLILQIDESGKYASCSSENHFSIFSLFNKHKLKLISSFSNFSNKIDNNLPDYIHHVHFNQNLNSFSSLCHSGIIRMWTNNHT